MKQRSLERIRFREDVWTSEDLTAREKLVALAFEDHVGDDGLQYVWVTRRRLQLRTKISSDLLQKAVSSLQAKGWIVLIEPGTGRRAARYQLVGDPSSDPDVRNATDEPSVPLSDRSVPISGSSDPDVRNRPMILDPSPQPPTRRTRAARSAPAANAPLPVDPHAFVADGSGLSCDECNLPAHHPVHQEP